MSGDGRQTMILPPPSAASAPEVGSTKAGTFSVWPAAVRTSSQVAACVVVPVHAVAAAATAGLAGSPTTTVPVSGRTASGEIALAFTCASTVPIWVPIAWVSVAVAVAGE